MSFCVIYSYPLLQMVRILSYLVLYRHQTGETKFLVVDIGLLLIWLLFTDLMTETHGSKYLKGFVCYRSS